MSALEGQGDPLTSGDSENIKRPDESALPPYDAGNITKSSKVGVGDTKKDEIDGNLVSIVSGTVGKSNIVDTNLKADTFAKGDQIFDKIASIAKELSKTTSVEAPPTSKGTIDEPQIISSDTNEKETEKDVKILNQDQITSNPNVNALLSQKNVPKDSTPTIELDKTKKEENKGGNDTSFDLNSSCDDDLELKWDDDENGDDYSTNLSEEALKLLDKELGIEDKVTNIETNTEITYDTIKQSTSKDPAEVKEHKLIVEDTKSEINKHIPVKIEGTAENVLENINSSTKIDETTETLPDINQSINKSTDITEKEINKTVFNDDNNVKSSTKSELTEPDLNSEVLNEETTVSSSNKPTDIVIKDEIVCQNEKMEDLNKQNEPEPIPDEELKDEVKDVDEPQMCRKLQITEDTIEMDTDTLNIADNSQITENIEEMDVDVSEELVDNPVEITKQSSIVEQESQIKVDEDKQEKSLLTDDTDIEMTEITDQSLKEIDSVEQVDDNPLSTENESDLSILKVPIDEEGKVVTDENVENIKTQVPTTKLNEKKVLSVTKGMKTDLGLNKPDVMLEIPTQELIDIDDFDDSLEMDKEIIDSEEYNETNTSTLETKTSLKEQTIAYNKNTKSTSEQQKTTTQSEEKDITITELVKIVTKTGESVEITEKLDKNDVKIDNNVDNLTSSDDSVPESNSIVNDNKIIEESSSKVSDDNLTEKPIVKIDDDNLIEEPTSKTIDSNLTDEPMSKSNNPTTKAMTVEAISEPNDDCMTDNQTSQINNSHTTKETSNLNVNLTAEVSEENPNVIEISCKAKDENMTEETSKLDQNMIYETVSKRNDSNVADDKITKELSSINMMTEISKITQETSKENPETFKLNMRVEPISKSSNDDNMTAESSKDKESSDDDCMAAELSKEESSVDDNMKEPSKDKESLDDDNMAAEASKDKESSDDVIITAEPSEEKSSDDIIITAALSKDEEPLDDDNMAAELSKDKESSGDVIIIAEPSKEHSSIDDNMTAEPPKDKESSDDITITAEPSKHKELLDDIIITAEPSKDKESSDDITITAEPSKHKELLDDIIITAEPSKDKESSDDITITAEPSKHKELLDDIFITAEPSKDKESSDDITITAEPSKHKELFDDIIITAEPSKDKESSDDITITAEPSEEKSSDDIIITAELSKDKESSDDDNMAAEASKDKSSDGIIITAELSKDKESSLNDNMTKESSPNTTETTSKVDDDIAEDPEISDSLGLLAESSRVMEDDDQDEDDDSDDFDHDDESSNLQTAEHSEESNPPSDEAQTTDKNIVIPDESILKEDTINYKEDTKTGKDIVCEETDIVEKVAASVESNIESATLGNEISQDESQLNVKESSDKEDDGGVLKKLLLEDNNQGDGSKKSPRKSTQLSISKDANIMTYVDLEESSEDEIEEINKEKSEEMKQESDEVTEETKVEEKKPKFTLKMTKLNTSEVTIKTGVSSITPLIIPEITNVSEIEKSKEISAVETKHCLEEIYSLDSDSDEEDIETSIEDVIQRKFNPKCINGMCTSSSTDQHYVADAAAMRHYGATKRRAICAPCLASVDTRNEELIKGIKDLRPLFDLNMEKAANQLVEISDSESDDDSDLIKECNDFIGQEGAKVLNEKLADIINDVWQKFNMDDRLKDSEYYINGELIRLEDEGTELNKLLDDCQMETDRIRNDLYSTFERNSKSLLTLTIYDTPTANYTCIEKDDSNQDDYTSPYLRSALEEPPAKRQNLGPSQNDTEIPPIPESAKQADDDRDVSVVLLSAESAPDDLPPPGEVVRPPLRVGMQVHAMRNAFGSWLRGRILDIQPKVPGQPYTNCRVKFDHNIKNPCKVLPARCIAYQEPCTVRMTIGTRVLALFKDSNRKESFYSGVVAEIPNPVNTYRYLVFFDDGYAQYVKHKDTRLVCESKSTVWEEVHPFIRDFVKDYLLKYPERPMVRLHAGQRLNTEWNGKWWTSKVLQVDASLAYVHFEEDDRTEWIYRGSTRLAPLYLELQAAGRSRTRLPRSKAQFRTNMPYVEYMRSEEQTKLQQQLQQEEMIRRQRAVAKKSVTLPQPTPMDKPDNVTSRVVYYTPKNAIKPYKMVSHTCGPQCKRTDVLSLKELRTYNPLAKPLLSGWERMQVRFKGSKHIMYRAPCGRRIRDMGELHQYLRTVHSDFPVDLFDFNVNTHCLAEFVLHKYNVMKKDLSHGKESVPVPCVNYYDDSLPEFCSYNTERTPTAGVPLNLDPDFLCGCDCEDDCMDKSKCACWKMTLEGARTIGLDSPNVGYVYRRLPEPLPSGIYECNARCKCKSTCLNRVAQHPLQLKLQVFKTLKRGWGIRALNDVPKGSFLCVYAGNLLTDATANLDGLNEGDEYLAELDYIEVVEQMKEGFEEDIPDADKKLDKKESKQPSSEDEETESEEDNRDSDKNDKEDDDFQPGYIGLGLTEFSKRLRKRGKKKQNEAQNNKENSTDALKTNDCITISDDEEVREPSRFTAQAGMGDKGFISKYSSVRTLFGRDEACYIMDAKVQGNIGRYLNHSCCPNVFVQNVFVDTHDPRFPWVAFFALSHIRAGTELTWNYNYDIGSVPGKILYCYCGAHNCRGRLL